MTIALLNQTELAYSTIPEGFWECKRVAYNGSSAAIWWLRSPYTSGGDNVWDVYTDGSSGGSWCNGSYGVRPALMEPCDE